MKNKTAFFTTKWITYTAMLTAMVVAVSYIPALPTPVGRVYWCDGIILLAAYLLDPLGAFIVGGIGTLLYDVLQSPSMMAASLVIHGLQAVIVSTLIHCVLPNLQKKKLWIEIVWAAAASIFAAVEVVLGYFTYRAVVYGVPAAYAAIPRNIIQEVIGITLALLICYAARLKDILRRNRLLPDFKAEILDERKKKAQQNETTPAV